MKMMDHQAALVGQYGHLIGAAQLAQSESAPDTLTSLEAKMGELHGRLNKLAQQAEEMAGKIYGHLPKDPGEGSSPTPAGIVPRLHESTGIVPRLHESTTLAFMKVNRVSDLLASISRTLG